jgi:hypothetical protein
MRNPGYAPSRTNSIDSSIGDLGSPLDGDAEDDMTYEKLEAEAREVSDTSYTLIIVGSICSQVTQHKLTEMFCNFRE